MTPPASGLDFVLARGVADGIITSDQAERLRALGVGLPEPTREQPPVAPPPSSHEAPSLVTEALGYLGGIILLVGTVLIASQFWPAVGPGGRLAIVLVASAVLLAGGVLLPEGLGAVGTRLRAVLWALSVVGLGGAVALLLYDVIDSDATYVPSLIFSLSTAYAFALWIWRPTVLQLAVAAAGTAATGGLVVGLLELPFAAVAAVVLAVGLVWLALGWARIITPPRATMAIGGAIAMVGSLLLGVDGEGTGWAVLTAIALVGVALHRRDLLLLGIGSLGVLVSLPALVSQWFPSVAAAALVLVVVGGLLVAAAVYTVRRPRLPADGPPSVTSGRPTGA